MGNHNYYINYADVYTKGELNGLGIRLLRIGAAAKVRRLLLPRQTTRETYLDAVATYLINLNNISFLGDMVCRLDSR
jgi:hypothetical protein